MTPNVESAQEMEIAQQYKNAHSAWAAKAAEWTLAYAK